MKIYATCYGDPSVGIFPSGATVDLPDWISSELLAENRKDLRQEFQEFFTKLFDEKATVLFDDECPDCGATGYRDGKCLRENCVQNLPDEEERNRFYPTYENKDYSEEIPF